MKTINSIEEINTEIVENILPRDDSRQPCWYVEFEKRSGKTSKWKVGVKSDDKNDEFSFSLSAIKDYEDEQWTKVISLEFATSLLSLYRNGGKKAVKEWISDGCP